HGGSSSVPATRRARISYHPEGGHARPAWPAGGRAAVHEATPPEYRRWQPLIARSGSALAALRAARLSCDDGLLPAAVRMPLRMKCARLLLGAVVAWVAIGPAAFAEPDTFFLGNGQDGALVVDGTTGDVIVNL